MIKRHYYPENYQKRRNHKHYFEGWYFKQVSADKGHTISFIPGISYHGNEVHSFIQCIYLNPHNELKSYYLSYDSDDFQTRTAPFSVRIDKSQFHLAGLEVRLNSPELTLEGSLRFHNRVSIKRSLLRPNIMGYFSYLPFMECKHGVLSMDHHIEGKISINGQEVDFTGGKGYIEKDWGRSFPSQYLWLQSNHFKEEGLAFFCSVATIPFLRTSFTGFIINLVHQEKEYRFATYTGAKLVVDDRGEDHAHLLVEDEAYQLEVWARPKVLQQLIAPKDGKMDHVIKEGLAGDLRLLLKSKEGGLLLETTSDHCGLELVTAL